MIEKGEVVSVGDGGVDVRLLPTGHCETCGLCDSVGGGAMVLADVSDIHGASLGDHVEVDVPDGSRLRASVLGFAVPVLMLLVAYLAGFLLGNTLGIDPDTSGAIAAAVAVTAGVIWLRARGRSIMSDQRFRPHVRAIIRRSAPR